MTQVSAGNAEEAFQKWAEVVGQDPGQWEWEDRSERALDHEPVLSRVTKNTVDLIRVSD